MVDFHDTRLPEDVERGAQGGPAFKTASHRKASGQRVATIEWAQPLGGYTVGYGIQTLADLQNVEAFFYARRGSAYAFRFKDWGDYEIDRQSVGTGDASKTVFQIFKRYADAVLPFDRTIQLPVSGTVLVWVNGVAQVEGVDFTVDYTTGEITFSVAPGAGEDVEVECQFDVPVAFAHDGFEKEVQTFLNGSVPKIELQIERL